MRGVAYALTASVALVFGALTPASAGCYGECNGYQEGGYRGGAPSYERSVYRERYSEAPAYDEGPRYRTTYYVRGPEYQTGYYERPAYRSSHYDGYDGGYRGGYYDRPYRRYSGYSYDRPYYRSYGYGYNYYPTVRVGGGWSQTGPGYGYGGGYGNVGWGGGSSYAGGYYGGCNTAYIPYGWTWYKARSC